MDVQDLIVPRNFFCPVAQNSVLKDRTFSSLTRLSAAARVRLFIVRKILKKPEWRRV